MAYDKEKIYQDSIKLSKTKGFFFIQDIIDYLACGKSTFYSFFPEDSDELDTLKNNLYQNRIVRKLKIREKLSEGSGGELIALYKLIGNDEERRALSTNWNNNKHSGEIKTKTTFTYGDFNEDSYSDDDI